MANERSNLLPATAVRRFTTYKHVIDIKLTIIQSVKKNIYIYIYIYIFCKAFFVIFFLFFLFLEKKDRTVIKVQASWHRFNNYTSFSKL